MFKATATGLNLCYGKDKEIIEIADVYLATALKKGWIYPEIEYIGDYSYKKKEDK